MNFWIIIAVCAYLLYALNGIADKFLLTKAVKHPIVYAFYIGATAPLTWLLIPFGLKFLSFSDFFIALFGGICFPIALYFNYSAIQKTSISRILPIMGGLVPLFTLILAFLLLAERLSNIQYLAFILLILGAVLISFKKEHRHWHAKAFGLALIAAIFFALSLTLTKYTFDRSNFVSGLIWTRLGFIVASASFLLLPKARHHILNAPKEVSNPNKILYYGTRLAGGAAGLMQNYAIALGSVTIVNALQGTQFVFLLILTSILSAKFPKILKEKITTSIIVQKIFAIILISIGLFFLTKS